jgi:hypothetical protein
MNKILIILIVVVIVLIALLVWGGIWSGTKTDPKTDPKLETFAQCLAGKNITMYGAKWCQWCQKEEAAFGDAFKYVPYVECPENVKKCLELGINGYPTWIFPDGKKLQGYQGLEKLSQESGCAL